MDSEPYRPFPVGSLGVDESDLVDSGRGNSAEKTKRMNLLRRSVFLGFKVCLNPEESATPRANESQSKVSELIVFLMKED